MAQPNHEIAGEVMAVVAEHAPPPQAAAITEALLHHFQGNQVYFPLRKARRDDEIRARLEAGASRQEIIREYAISNSTLVRILRRG